MFEGKGRIFVNSILDLGMNLIVKKSEYNLQGPGKGK